MLSCSFITHTNTVDNSASIHPTACGKGNGKRHIYFSQQRRLSHFQQLSVYKASICQNAYSKNHIELLKLQNTLEKAFQQGHPNSLESSVQWQMAITCSNETRRTKYFWFCCTTIDWVSFHGIFGGDWTEGRRGTEDCNSAILSNYYRNGRKALHLGLIFSFAQQWKPHS